MHDAQRGICGIIGIDPQSPKGMSRDALKLYYVLRLVFDFYGFWTSSHQFLRKDRQSNLRKKADKERFETGETLAGTIRRLTFGPRLPAMQWTVSSPGDRQDKGKVVEQLHKTAGLLEGYAA